jgi:hypothetical protein
MQLALLTTVADESRTMLLCGLTARRSGRTVRTIGGSVIAALPFIGIPHSRFSANADPIAGLNCS